jgi:hypothetical protein
MADASEDESLEQIPINSFPVALSLLYQYLNIASRRGAFNLQESAKIMNCLQYIGSVVRPVEEQQQQPPAAPTTQTAPAPAPTAQPAPATAPAATTQPKKKA